MSIEEQKRLNYLNERLEELNIDEWIEFFELLGRYSKLKAKEGINIWKQ